MAVAFPLAEPNDITQVGNWLVPKQGSLEDKARNFVFFDKLLL